MTEIIMGVLIVVCGTLIGNSFAQKLISRKNSIEGIIEAIEKMKTFINFSSMEIVPVISESFTNIVGFEIFTTSPADEETFTDWWEKCVDNLSSNLGLVKEDKILLKRFSMEIGVSDVEGQISHCDLYKRLFLERLKLVKDLVDTKARLFRILGFSLGSAVTLIVV